MGSSEGRVASGPASTPRQRDRRRGFGELLATLSRGVTNRSDPALLRGAFEESLRKSLAVRTVHLRDATSRWNNGPDATPMESVAFEVPGPSPKARGVLEATFDPMCRPGEWDFQLLGMAAHLGALLLELERTRRPIPRSDGMAAGGASRPDGAAPLIGSTPAMAALRSRIERIAVTDFTVLLEGESGSGKELVARLIHELSPRRAGPFVAINCAALVETLLEAELFGIEERTATGVRGRRGKFEHADGGTLFLDEVSDLSVSAQAKLLRAIQDLSVERVGGQGSHTRQHPDRRRHEPRPVRPGGPRIVPARSVLSSRRRGHPRAAAARTPPRCPRARDVLSWRVTARRGRCRCRRPPCRCWLNTTGPAMSASSSD